MKMHIRLFLGGIVITVLSILGFVFASFAIKLISLIMLPLGLGLITVAFVSRHYGKE